MLHAGTPVGCRAALGFVEKQLSEAALLLFVRSSCLALASQTARFRAERQRG
jgi:hypothetical protein